MKKLVLLSLLAGVLLVFGVGNSSSSNDALPAQLGIILDIDYYCNDYFLVCNMQSSKIYDAHGYEYGCGYNDRIAHGAVRVAGGYAYFGVEKIMPGGGTVGVDHIMIQISTKTGTFGWSYFQASGGGATTWGGSEVGYLYISGDPNPVTPPDFAGRDSSIR